MLQSIALLLIYEKFPIHSNNRDMINDEDYRRVGDGEHFGGAAWSNHPDGYQGDADGIASARNLGRNMAKLGRMMQL